MPLGRTFCVALVGLNGSMVEVEADIGQTLPAFILLGLPDTALNEAKERIRAAAKNAGIPLSRRKITVNLIPASLPKKGSAFDLSIVMSVLRAAGDIHETGRTVFLAELGLDGRLRPVRGVLPSVMAAAEAGYTEIVVASENAREAELVPGVTVRGFATLAEVALAFGANAGDRRLPDPEVKSETSVYGAPENEHRAHPGAPDMSEVAGQLEARFAVEVAAAGAHHLLMTGPPGAGKTMLAERLPGLLPDLTDGEAMEVTAIRSLCEAAGPCNQLVRRPPFENPHHSATTASIVGGGSGIPRPGAASRAHRGVLFLDEAPEYDRGVLDALRQPLEKGELTLHRALGTASYPARFQLVLAANPCPCGLATAKGIDCHCTPQQRRRYFHRLSGPLLDRVDLQLVVQRVSLHEIAATGSAEPTEIIASRVAAARQVQADRLVRWGSSVNSEVPAKLFQTVLKPPRSATGSLDRAMERHVLSARGYVRVLRVAWTIADLNGHTVPDADDVGQALGFRQEVSAL